MNQNPYNAEVNTNRQKGIEKNFQQKTNHAKVGNVGFWILDVGGQILDVRH